MNSEKISVNQTGTLFYTKYSYNSNGFRVRFKSFNMSVYDNREKLTQLDELYSNYALFK